MWKADGWGARARIGVLTPHADLGPECEFQAMSPPDVMIHAARVPFGGFAPGGTMDPTIPLAPVRAFAEPPGVDDAVELLAAAPIHAIGFGSTSSAYVIGHEGEAANQVLFWAALHATGMAVPVDRYGRLFET